MCLVYDFNTHEYVFFFSWASDVEYLEIIIWYVCMYVCHILSTSISQSPLRGLHRIRNQLLSSLRDYISF